MYNNAPPPPYSDSLTQQHHSQQHSHSQQVHHGTVPQGVVCYGNHIALKHNMTGRYLSSRDKRYTTGSQQQEVFTNRWQPNPSHDFWIVIPALHEHHQPGEPVLYNHIIRLKHVETRRNLHSHANIRSPTTGQQEVTGFGNDIESDENDHWRVERFEHQPHDKEEWRVNDVFILRHVLTDHTLHSHENGLDSEDINEVTAFGPEKDENDKWSVEGCGPVEGGVIQIKATFAFDEAP